MEDYKRYMLNYTLTKDQGEYRMKNRLSLTYKLVIFTILVILLPASLIGMFFYAKTSSVLTHNATAYLNEYILQITDNIETKFRIINNTSLLFLSNPTLRVALDDSTQDSDYVSQVQLKAETERQLNYLLLFNYAWDSKLLKSIHIFKGENIFYTVHRFHIAGINLDKLFEINDGVSKTPAKNQFYPPSSDDRTMYFVCNVNNLNTLELLGRLIFRIDENELANIGNKSMQYEGTQVCIFDSTGVIFSHTDKSMLGKMVDEKLFNIRNNRSIVDVEINGEPCLVAARNLKDHGFTSVVSIPRKQVYINLSSTMDQYIRIMVLILLVSMLIAAAMSSRVTKPVRDLMKSIVQVKNGNFNSRMPEYKDYEMNQLSDVFNKMTDEINYLINQVYEKQLLLKESELESLRSQVNPHFIFNVLGTISWEAQISKNDKIYTMATSLGQLLRAHLSNDSREKITMREEFEYIELGFDNDHVDIHLVSPAKYCVSNVVVSIK